MKQKMSEEGRRGFVIFFLLLTFISLTVSVVMSPTWVMDREETIVVGILLGIALVAILKLDENIIQSIRLFKARRRWERERMNLSHKR